LFRRISCFSNVVCTFVTSNDSFRVFIVIGVESNVVCTFVTSNDSFRVFIVIGVESNLLNGVEDLGPWLLPSIFLGLETSIALFHHLSI
jgi:hypothetical protein